MLQSYDDIALLAPGVDVAVSLGDLLNQARYESAELGGVSQGPGSRFGVGSSSGGS